MNSAAQPHFVILLTNDLVSTMTPFERLAIAKKVVGLARELNSWFNVSVCMICTIIDRFEGLRVIRPQQFHDQLYHVNNMVMKFCQSRHNIKYYMKKGFWQIRQSNSHRMAPILTNLKVAVPIRKPLGGPYFMQQNICEKRATSETTKYPRRPRDQYTAQIVNTLEPSAPPPNRG